MLFENVSLQLNAGSRYGLVGANGSGKTTFLKILAGDEAASAGSFTIDKGARIGVLRQDRFLDDDAIILDLAMRGDAVVWSALAEQQPLVEARRRRRARRRRAAWRTSRTSSRRTTATRSRRARARCSRAWASRRACTARRCRRCRAASSCASCSRRCSWAASTCCSSTSRRTTSTSSRSAGSRSSSPATQGCAVIISHDQRFLDNVTSHTLDVDYRTLTLFTGGYSRAMVDKTAARERAEVSLARAEAEIARKREWVERFGAKNTKATQAQSRVKQIEKIEVELEARRDLAPHADLPRRRRRARAARRCSRSAASSKAYGDKVVLKGRVARRAARRARRDHRAERARQVDAPPHRRRAHRGRRGHA